MELRTLNKLLAPIKRQVRQLITRGVVKLIDTQTLCTSLQVVALDGETLDNIEYFEPFGFTSTPLRGAEGVLLSSNGKRSHTVAVCVGNRLYRLKGLAEGESAQYNHLGDYIKLKNGRIVEVVAGAKVDVTAPEAVFHCSTKVTLDTPLVEATQNMTIGGTLQVTGAVTMQSTASVAGMATVGGLASTGAAGASSVSGNLSITGGDVLVDGTSSKHHRHADAQGGIVGEPI